MKAKKQALSEQYDRSSTSELLRLLDDSSIISRMHALTALARRSCQDESLIKRVVEAISDSRNLNARLRGSISVSHLGVASLLRTRKSKSVSAAEQLIDQWQEPDRSDLLWFLQSESLLIENRQESPLLQVWR